MECRRGRFSSTRILFLFVTILTGFSYLTRKIAVFCGQFFADMHQDTDRRGYFCERGFFRIIFLNGRCWFVLHVRSED